VLILFCSRGCGRNGRPAFPAPSDFLGGKLLAKLGRIAPRDREVVFANMTGCLKGQVGRPEAGRTGGSSLRKQGPITTTAAVKPGRLLQLNHLEPAVVMGPGSRSLCSLGRDDREHGLSRLLLGERAMPAPYDQNDGRPRAWRELSPWRAFSSVVEKYSSRSRLNFSWVALKLATRAAISSRS
jgi:hypothetical protein